ncbi:MAG: 5'/3'-nucleotidase SurE [Holosporaceae bacterium]|nr:5'/3'-nucleotidase SurE [Holosporaceae bacterium]
MMVKPTLSGLRILIVNDDSVNANGIKALERIALSITPDVWVVAPEIGQSGKGFSITFDSIIRINEISPRKFSTSGTPADCVFVALQQILSDQKPDLILSGINHGANVADFISMSGTVGAAFAAASQGIRAIAVSQHFTRECPTKFHLVEHFLPLIIKKLMSVSWPDQVCMNVNFPEAPFSGVSGIRIANQGKLKVTWNVCQKMDPVDRKYYWIHGDYEHQESTNSDALLVEKENCVTITPLQCCYEYTEYMEKLEELFATNV